MTIRFPRRCRQPSNDTRDIVDVSTLSRFEHEWKVVIAGMGLTVSFFIAGGEAFSDPRVHEGVKMGALLSGAIAPVAIAPGNAPKTRQSKD